MKEHTTLENATTTLTACTAIAVDLAKRVFQIAAEDTCGQVLYSASNRARHHRSGAKNGRNDTHAILHGVPLILEGAKVPVLQLLRELLAHLLAQWQHLGQRIQALTGKLQAQARQDLQARQLMTVRGIGAITATALLAKQTEPERFKNARQFAAYFGAIPLAGGRSFHSYRTVSIRPNRRSDKS